VQPWPAETFTFPELVAKVTDIIGSYFAPAESPIVLCVDEKSRFRRWIGPEGAAELGHAEQRTSTRDPSQPVWSRNVAASLLTCGPAHQALDRGSVEDARSHKRVGNRRKL
jgi:hypothetical protein